MRRLLRASLDARGASLMELQVALIILQVVFLMVFAYGARRRPGS